MAKNPSVNQPLVNPQTGIVTDSWLRFLMSLGDISDPTGIVPIVKGGTGAVTAAGARTNLGIGPGGTPGQLQYNNAGNFGGLTVSGDGTLNTATGALTITKTGGVSFGPLATDIGTSTGTGPLVRAGSPTFTGTFNAVNANFSGTVTGLSATFVSVFGSFVNLTNTSSTAQLHLSGTGNDDGAYFVGEGPSNAYIGGGVSKVPAGWVAKDTGASVLAISGGAGFVLFANTGLTIGASYTPTNRFQVDGTGTVTVGIIPAARVTGLATVATSGSAADLTGTLAAARLPSFGSGDVSFATAGGAGTIANDAVTYAKMQNVSATSRFIGRKTAGAGDPEELSAADAKTILAYAFSDLSGSATAAQGGTGQTSYAIGDLLYASGSTALSRLAGVATGNALISGGVTTAPLWGKITTSHTTGIAASGANSDITSLTGLGTSSWTPSIKFGGNSTGMTYLAQTGTYFQVGKLIFACGHVTLSAKGSSTGAATFTGLPVTSGSNLGPVTFHYNAGMSGITGAPISYVNSSATTVALYMQGTTGATGLTDANFTNASDIYFTAIYLTA